MSTPSTPVEMPLLTEQDIVLARQAVRKTAQQIGFSLVDQTKMVTATSELARNAYKHGGGGKMISTVIQGNGRTGLQVVFVDTGSGIVNMDLAMSDGWTSGGGMGMGLPGARRLVNEFDIQSQPGAGTRVTIVRWK